MEKFDDIDGNKSVRNEIRELTDKLNLASRAYYQESREIMSNLEYDRLYDRLLKLEEESGIILSNSPTRHVGYEVLSELPKERHEKAMLSLDKTKDREALKEWLGNQKGRLSYKLDGLTIVLTYENGELKKAVTRGNGEVGEVITQNARVFKNIPISIPNKRSFIVRGEALIRYSDFEKINREIPETDVKYKNPRNLCSGTVRQLNNEITAARPVYFYAFTLVDLDAQYFTDNPGQSPKGADGVDFKTKSEQLKWLDEQGFDVVEGKIVDKDNILDTIEWFSGQLGKSDLPSDGLVLTYDDIAYSRSLGRTAKFPRDSFAFKWKDEQRETTLLEMEWSASRTGLINPVAIFEPVELEGTSVSRASVHNVSIVEALELGIGDTILVYKANMIIPQIADNLTRSGSLVIPRECPVCHGAAEISEENGVKSLYCMNPDCQAKKIKSFVHFAGRDAMNIEGLSEATLEKFVDRGMIRSYTDIYHLDRYREDIISMEGFGEKSYEKLLASVEKSRKTTSYRLLYSLGIENIGLSTAKIICGLCSKDVREIPKTDAKKLTEADGIGEVIAASFKSYFENQDNLKVYNELLDELSFEEEEETGELLLSGLNFVVTGAVNHFPNRNSLKEQVERLGGKVTGSVTGNTDYLINNDTTSNSSKNKKAKELGVPIISEEEFMEMAGVRF